MAQSNAAQAVANIFKTPELREKILFTLLCLLVYRIGAHITAPGVDVVALTRLLPQPGAAGGLLGLYDLFAGGQLSRATVFALGIMPYISASIFVQIAGAVIPTVEKMQKDEEGRKKINQWTRYATVVPRHRRRRGASRCSPSRCRARSPTPGFGFKLQMAFFLTTGAVFVMWLGEQITERGLGNGAQPDHLLLDRRAHLAGHRARRSASSRTGAIGPFSLLVLAIVMVGGGGRRSWRSRWRRGGC